MSVSTWKERFPYTETQGPEGYIRVHRTSVEAIRKLHADGFDGPDISTKTSDDWAGANKSETQELLLRGNLKVMPQVEKMRAFSNAVSRDVAFLPTPNPALCGGAVSIPRYLAGAPNSFMRVSQGTQPAGIRIYAAVNGSGGIAAGDFTKRAIAIMGLVRALSRVRPVELILCRFTEWDNNVQTAIMIPINTAVPDWTAITAAMHPAVFRRILIPMGEVFGEQRFNTNGGITLTKVSDEFRNAAGIRPNDLVLFGLREDIPESMKAVKNPELWVKEQLKTLGARQ